MPKLFFYIDILSVQVYDCIKGTGYLTGYMLTFYIQNKTKKEEMELKRRLMYLTAMLLAFSAVGLTGCQQKELPDMMRANLICRSGYTPSKTLRRDRLTKNP